MTHRAYILSAKAYIWVFFHSVVLIKYENVYLISILMYIEMTYNDV